MSHIALYDRQVERAQAALVRAIEELHEAASKGQLAHIGGLVATVTSRNAHLIEVEAERVGYATALREVAEVWIDHPTI